MPNIDNPTISLREHYDALATADRRLQAERDRRQDERADAAKEAVAAALVAQKELLAAALAASKEAVIKQETTSSQLLNALTEKIDTLGKDLGSRIEQLAKSSDQGVGKGAGLQAGWLYLLGGLSLIGTILGIVGAVAAFVR
jgi:hypothetical protein